MVHFMALWMQYRKNGVDEGGCLEMSDTKKSVIWSVIYGLIFINAYSQLRKYLFNPWIDMIGRPFQLYNLLCMCAFVNVYSVTFCTILRGGFVRRWRKTMKRNLWAWGLLAVCIIAFTIMMFEVYVTMEYRFAAIRIIFSATVIFIPNTLALVQCICEKKS